MGGLTKKPKKPKAPKPLAPQAVAQVAEQTPDQTVLEAQGRSGYQKSILTGSLTPYKGKKKKLA